MNNLERLLLDLDQACEHPEAKSNKQLAEMARQYNQFCEEANNRASRCAFYLQQGFRGEAIRACEQEPNLIEQMHRLNFAKRAIWVDIASQLGVHTPVLLTNLARQLNEEYNMHDATQDLARRNRLQNLLRHPADQRMETLAALREVDPVCSSWQFNIDQLRD